MPFETSPTIDRLEAEVAHRTKLQAICNKIHGAKNLDALFVSLGGEIADLFQAERFTVYGLDGIRRHLVSRFKTGSEIREIRIPVSAASVAGYTALKGRVVNIRDVHDSRELRAVDPDLCFDHRWDQRSGYATRQVLAAPILFENYLMGVVQVINRKPGERFMAEDEQGIREIAEMFGIAFYNQKRLSQRRSGRYSFLLDSGSPFRGDSSEGQGGGSRLGSTPGQGAHGTVRHQKGGPGQIPQPVFQEPPSWETGPPSEIPSSLLKGLKPDFMKRNMFTPWRMEEGRVDIAMDDPDDLDRIDSIKPLFQGQPLRFCVALGEDILAANDHLAERMSSPQAIDDIIQRMKSDAEALEEEAGDAREQDSTVIQLVNKMISDALEMGASDIHVEPYPGRRETEIRIRVDGECCLYGKIPSTYKQAVASRIKVMADLDIAEHRRPQDGKIDFGKFGKKPVELRVATLPTQGGVEDVVLRILATGTPVSMEALAFSPRNLEKFQQAVEMPYGLILVCGPTGSGKTTTLHAALRHLNNAKRKIWTAEDPVEITQPGLRQVQVRPKINFGFAEALRAFLRADPDVIMVGEMRDAETARIGIEASLTGHLVLSTLHTNSACESIIRLLDLGMDPFHFADAVRCVLAQRLVQTLCEECKESYPPSREEFDGLVREYGPEAFWQDSVAVFSERLLLFRPKGCPSCGGTGYRGRMGIHELLMGSEKIRQMVQKRVSVEALRCQAASEGMVSLKQDGIRKVFSGHCDLFQIRKVCIL